MITNRSRNINCNKGFTLIELMIVIAIIGILAAIAAPNFLSYRNKTFCSAAETDVQTILGAISDYFSDPGSLSVSKTTLGIADGPNGDLSNSNTYQILPVGTASYRVIVKDTTGRCPKFTTTSGEI